MVEAGDEDVGEVEPGECDEGHEVVVVAYANALVDPLAVVVHPPYALVANVAVSCVRLLKYLASGTQVLRLEVLV